MELQRDGISLAKTKYPQVVVAAGEQIVFPRAEWPCSTQRISAGKLIDHVSECRSVPVVVAPLPWQTEMDANDVSQIVAVRSFIADILDGEGCHRVSLRIANRASTVV
jgi:hypothetical protein